jgi:hypothetical protein
MVVENNICWLYILGTVFDIRQLEFNNFDENCAMHNSCLTVNAYEVCPKSKCIDFSMYYLETQHLDVYRRVDNDLGCMYILVQTGWVESVVTIAVCVRSCFITSVIFGMHKDS